MSPRPPRSLTLACVALVALPLAAQSAKLNDPLPRVRPGGAVRGDVTGFQSALGVGRVVYRADQVTDEVFGLFSARLDLASGPVALTAGLDAVGNVDPEFQVSPGGEFVVFEHVPFGESVGHLYVVPTSGIQPPLLLDGPALFLPPYLLSISTGRVVYRCGPSGGPFALCSVPLDGSAPSHTLHPLGFGVDAEFQLSPDGARAVYRGDVEPLDGSHELYVVPVDGSELPRRLDPDAGRSGLFGVSSIALTSDGSRAAYRGDGQLFSVLLDGSRLRERLDDPSLSTGPVMRFALTADDQRVVFVDDGRQSGRLRLYSAPIAGRRPPRGRPGGELERDPELLTPMPHFGDVRQVYPFQLSADGEYALYSADPRVDERFELYRVRTDGRTPPVLLSPDSGASVGSFALAPDQTSVVYLDDFLGSPALHRVPLAGGPPVRLDSTQPEPIQIETFRIAPDSSFVFFLGQRSSVGSRELFAVPLDGSAPARSLNGPLPASRATLYDFVPLPRGRVLYRADQESYEALELFEGFAGRARPAPR